MAEFVEHKRINGNMLRTEKGRISIMLEVMNENGTTLQAKSTDGKEIRVRLPEPLNARAGNWVEIIGMPTSDKEITASEAILFSEEDVKFDKESYNMMVLFLNNAKDIFRSG